MRTWIQDIGKKENGEVKIYGWVETRRDHGKIIFIDLRDKTGIAQVVFGTEDKELYQKANKLRNEWVIKIEGTVKKRPKGMENPNLTTGNFEISAKNLEILSEAKTLPIAIDKDGYEINEEARLRYRYLDLRRKRIFKNLKCRHLAFKFIRDWLTNKGFLEVETPILGKSTPEGARDYLVPSRLERGKFYALPQSPQQYKQLLMVAGIERYFQIARCFRDEDTRGDRQPEFTQLDLEMSFVEEHDVLSLVEALFTDLVKKIFPEKQITKIPFPRLDYQEAIKQYNSDKPDLRKNKNNNNELSFVFIVNFPMFEWKKESSYAEASEGKEKRLAGRSLGEGRWDAVHHPFTRIKNEELRIKNRGEFIKYIKENPQELIAHQYDLVCNGYEIGGGSIREHNPEILEAVFEIMGHNKKDIREKFGHLLDAFEYGVPPHGGIALGLDRILMILMNEPNIREVMAFPKTGDGRDLMMGAPSEVDKNQLKELGLEIKSRRKVGTPTEASEKTKR